MKNNTILIPAILLFILTSTGNVSANSFEERNSDGNKIKCNEVRVVLDEDDIEKMKDEIRMDPERQKKYEQLSIELEKFEYKAKIAKEKNR